MFKKEGGDKQKTKKGRIHHGIKIPCFLRQLINKNNYTTKNKDLSSLQIDPYFYYFILLNQLL
ncbi:hypothetical protein LAYK6_18060 [Lactobacillus amylovorus subsp. amylovorus]|nr:hypothetical protein LAYK6_18060 [Lactobacillus amylovorus]